MRKRTKFGHFWFGFKVFTILISFLFSVLFSFIVGFAVFNHQYSFAAFNLLLAVALWSFSKILDQDLIAEETARLKEENKDKTTVFRFDNRGS
jgi:hypothetical protein